CYTDSWAPVHPVHFNHVGSEVNVQFINVASPSDPVNVVDCEITIENNKATLALCIPYSTIDPVKEILKGTFVADETEQDASLTDRLKANLMESTLELSAILGSATITGRDLLRLKAGDIIQLNEDSESPVEIMVEGTRKFWGMVGAHKSNRALQITAVEEMKRDK
ncbi:flagellar motor switch protein FliM, partial [bacterium]|nr:flagellar motor switch protein FliM [bacterium]